MIVSVNNFEAKIIYQPPWGSSKHISFVPWNNQTKFGMLDKGRVIMVHRVNFVFKLALAVMSILGGHHRYRPKIQPARHLYPGMGLQLGVFQFFLQSK